MSFKKNDYQQMTLHDSFLNLSPRVKKIVENSWCSDFANIVFKHSQFYTAVTRHPDLIRQ